MKCHSRQTFSSVGASGESGRGGGEGEGGREGETARAAHEARAARIVHHRARDAFQGRIGSQLDLNLLSPLKHAEISNKL